MDGRRRAESAGQLWCNRHSPLEDIHTWSRTQLDGENTRIGRADADADGGEVHPNEGRKGGSNHLLVFVVVGPTFAHLSSSLRIRIDNDRPGARTRTRTATATGIWAYAMEGGGMNGADADDGGVKIC